MKGTRHGRGRECREPLLPEQTPELVAILEVTCMLEVKQLVLHERLQRVIVMDARNHIRAEHHHFFLTHNDKAPHREGLCHQSIERAGGEQPAASQQQQTSVLLRPLAEALQQPGERRVLLHLDA